MQARKDASQFWLTAILLLFFCEISTIKANDFESLFMPGDVSSAHAKYEKDCNQCHSKFEKNRQDKLCLACHDHKDVAEDIKQGKGFHGRLGKKSRTSCKQCHREHKGRDVSIVVLSKGTFNHNNTDFVLKGRHRTVACGACHKQKEKYRQAPGRCIDCHEKVDIHKGDLGKKCETCHVPSGWKKSGFDHDKDTKFALKGKHAKTSCALCHIDNRYKKTPRQCSQCHGLNDVHQGRYGKKCETCHSSKKWKETLFNHERDTKYALQGKHKKIKCDQCHTGYIYKQKLGKTCISCHRNDDVHKNSNGNKCEQCHFSTGWKKSKFDHDRKTEFPLKGKHKQIRCQACHKGKTKEKTSSKCIACHKHNDVHEKQMGKQCEQCHNSQGWTVRVMFEHDITSFPLIGIHAVTACEECHSSAAYKDASLQCRACHKNVDKHEGRFGGNCAQCHNPNSWKVWLFDHDRQTDFRLQGAHKNIHCNQCHVREMADKHKAPSTCAGCHLADDIHRGQFGRRCERCHNTERFSDIEMHR